MVSPKVAVIGFLRFPPERMAEMLPAVRIFLDASNLEEGCMGYHMGVDAQDPGLLRVSELWSDKAALDRHVTAPHIAPWHAAQKRCQMIERSYTIIDIANARMV